MKRLATKITRLAIYPVAAALLTVGGCTTSFDDQPFADWIEGNEEAWRLDDEATLHRLETLPTTQPAEASSYEVPPDAGPEDYVRMALDRNPELLSARYGIERLAERVPQVTSLDDPMLSVAPVGEMAETAAGQVGVMTSLSQRLPLPQKLNARGNIARQDIAIARSELEETRLRVIADTRQAFWSYYFAIHAIRVTEDTAALLERMRESVEARLRVGTAQQADLLRLMTELSNTENQLLTYRQQAATAAARINSLIDRPVDAPLPEPPMAEPDIVPLRLERLLDVAAESNPQLQQVLARIAQDRARLRLARLGYWPDLTVGLNYNFVDEEGLAVMANGQDQYWASFAINLPIWQGRLRAAEREALRGLQENVADLTAAQNRLAFQVRDAFAQAETQQRSVALLRDVIVPQARQTVEASEAGYRAGTVDFITYVENWQRLLMFRHMYHQSVAQLEKAIAELERLLGQDLPRQSADMPRIRPQVPQPGSATNQDIEEVESQP